MKNLRFLLQGVVMLLLASSGMAQSNIGEREFDAAALKQLAERGNADAQFELGIRYLGGEGLDKDEQKAVEWLTRAADQEKLEAMNALGTMNEEGVGFPKDEKKAFEWYEKAAKYGFPLAQQNLSQCYEMGKGVEKNQAEANKWLERAAHQDFAPSQAMYAFKLERGLGLDKNTRSAAEWYLKAAQNGLIRAMTHLAYLYYTGTGVPLDYRRAEAWYRRAARSDDPWARNDLAWFLAVCPDQSFHDGDAAVEVARSAVDKLSGKQYEMIDTLAAALARTGKFGEAVQLQMKAIVMFDDDKEKTKEVSAEEHDKLEKELSDRLQNYKKQSPFTEKDPSPESGVKPLIEDRILQEEGVPRRKPKPAPRKGDDGGDDKP
ncbi:MAG TPA: tetratricopeptide repeat protein, partial [Verrucomicrobium sp.]|nr:tetratricopeptide repeat protein [Verrucomicrobium sp.]